MIWETGPQAELGETSLDLSAAGRMNNNRLSTCLVKSDNISDEEVQRLLASPSNLAKHSNGKV